VLDVEKGNKKGGSFTVALLRFRTVKGGFMSNTKAVILTILVFILFIISIVFGSYVMDEISNHDILNKILDFIVNTYIIIIAAIFFVGILVRLVFKKK